MFFLTFLLLISILPSSNTLDCPKCVTIINFNDSIEIPTTCGHSSGDYCTLDIIMNFQTSTIQLDFDRKLVDTLDASAYTRSVTYMSYYDFDENDIFIDMTISCSNSDQCAFEMGEKHLKKILREIPTSSERNNVLSKLKDILIASPGSVSVNQCYKPKDEKESCQPNSHCSVEHVLPMKKQPEFDWSKHHRNDVTRWRAGCTTDESAKYRLTMGYSFTEPTLNRTADYLIFAADCNKTLCNGGPSRQNVIKLLNNYPTVGGWYREASSAFSILSQSHHLLLLVVFIGSIRHYTMSK